MFELAITADSGPTAWRAYFSCPPFTTAGGTLRSYRMADGSTPEEAMTKAIVEHAKYRMKA